MADNNIAALPIFVQPSSSSDVEQKTVGVAVPATQGPLESINTSINLVAAHAERIIRLEHATSNNAIIDANTQLGNGNSVRLYRETAGTAKVSWGSGIKVDGVTAAGERVIASSYKSIMVTQLASGVFAIEGNIAS